MSCETVKRFEKLNWFEEHTTKAETLAKKLASDCYMRAVKFFSSLLVIVFATCFLIYYTFKNGTPQNLSGLMVFAFFSGPMFLLQGFVGSMKRFSKRSILTFFSVTKSTMGQPPTARGAQRFPRKR